MHWMFLMEIYGFFMENNSLFIRYSPIYSLQKKTDTSLRQHKICKERVYGKEDKTLTWFTNMADEFSSTHVAPLANASN